MVHQRGQGYASAKPAVALRSKSSNSPRRSFGNAAAAIIAALSVDSAGVGKNTGQGRLALLAAARNPAFAATPPEMITARAPISSAAAATRRSSSSITVL